MGNESEQMALSVTLQMPEDTRAELRSSETAIVQAESFEIDCHELAVAANDELRMVKDRRARIESLRKSFIQPAQQIIDNANALFNPADKALAQAEAVIKAKLVAYQEGQQRKAEEQRRLVDEAARKARQEAEQRAAAERAKAQQRADELRRMADEAEAARVALEADGKKRRQAQQAAAEAAKLREQADQTIENGEAKAREAQLAAAASAAPSAIAAPAKLEGFTTRENWICEFEQGLDENGVKKKLVEHLKERPELLALLKLDMTAAGRIARALKAAFNVPGLVARNDPIAASTRR